MTVTDSIGNGVINFTDIYIYIYININSMSSLQH